MTYEIIELIIDRGAKIPPELKEWEVVSEEVCCGGKRIILRKPVNKG